MRVHKPKETWKHYWSPSRQLVPAGWVQKQFCTSDYSVIQPWALLWLSSFPRVASNSPLPGWRFLSLLLVAGFLAVWKPQQAWWLSPVSVTGRFVHTAGWGIQEALMTAHRHVKAREQADLAGWGASKTGLGFSPWALWRQRGQSRVWLWCRELVNAWMEGKDGWRDEQPCRIIGEGNSVRNWEEKRKAQNKEKKDCISLVREACYKLLFSLLSFPTSGEFCVFVTQNYICVSSCYHLLPHKEEQPVEFAHSKSRPSFFPWLHQEPHIIFASLPNWTVLV